MKTRLLKKIRKQFNIIKVDKLASNANSIEKDMAKSGLPFYILQDNRYSWGDRYCADYEQAHTELMKKIMEKYSEKFRHNGGTYTKVWWKK